MFYNDGNMMCNINYTRNFIKCTDVVLIFQGRERKKYKYFKNNCLFIW